MGRRSEQRIAISFPVIVSGFDSHGSPFSITAETQDISNSGACLRGLDHLVEPGKKIEIECREQTAWFRVQWVGEAGTERAGKVGVRCLQHGKHIWGVQPKASEPDTYEPRAPAPAIRESQSSGYATNEPAGSSAAEHRRFSRRTCHIEAQVMVAGDSVLLPSIVTDVSLSGCYAEMLVPLPVGTIVELMLNPGDTTIRATGKVLSSKVGLGMGISFTGLSPENFEKLRKFAPPAAGIPETALEPSRLPPTPQTRGNAHPPISHSPAGQSSSLHQATSAEVFEAVVRVLFRKGVLSQAELAEELERLKVMKA